MVGIREGGKCTEKGRTGRGGGSLVKEEPISFGLLERARRFGERPAKAALGGADGFLILSPGESNWSQLGGIPQLHCLIGR